MEPISGGTIILYGILASTIAGLATGIGAFPSLFVRSVSDRFMDSSLGFAAGVMLAATSFSLIVPAIEAGGIWITVIGIAVGAVFLDRADKWIPHEHFLKGPEGPSSTLRRTWLFILAITLHNFPEGLAVGVGFGGGDVAGGTALAIGIGLQNMPEGLAVALPLLREKYSRGKALLIATASGLVEPIGGLIGVGAVTLARPFLPLGLAFAAGAMLFVISDEIIPETHSRGNEREATFGVIIGFLVMMTLDNLFG
ncbi:MAG: ZIP family metal transporter [Deltaproteobacteria bacterium]|nr:ZIP family metal transporter [Deltaproteobacteria bacterium]MBW2308028.1 ZIP family metal transporter [Deltaproteobacteria bacterium]